MNPDTPETPELPDDDLDAFLVDDLLDLDLDAADPAGDPLETDHMPTARTLRADARRRYLRVRQRQALADLVGPAPAPGETLHVLSSATADFWTWVQTLIDLIGGRTEHLYCSTWTASRGNVVDLFALMDADKIGDAAFLTGLYFKRRETAVYTTLVNGLRQRGGRYKAFLNHAKVLLLDDPDGEHYLTVEGSANLTSNPRLEQYAVTNHRGLWTWHHAWMEECLNK